ncbi:MAG: ATP-dependent helicase, partial [Burkholderiales bacterium]
PRGDQRPDNRGGDRFDSRDSRAPRAPGRDNARGGASDRPARGPKVMGAGNFKPHNAGGHAAPKRTGAKVLKITRG